MLLVVIDGFFRRRKKNDAKSIDIGADVTSIMML